MDSLSTLKPALDRIPCVCHISNSFCPPCALTLLSIVSSLERGEILDGDDENDEDPSMVRRFPLLMVAYRLMLLG